MKNLKPIKGKYYIADLISRGEHEHQDFKYAVSDAAKIAHSISAFANNDGGALLIGVKDNGVVAGVRNDEDIYVVEQAALMYCKPPQQVKFTSFTVDSGLVVIRAEIPKSPTRPVMCRDNKGNYKAYYRVADENIPVSALMLKAWSRADGDDSAQLCLGGHETVLLGLIDNRSGLTVEEAMVKLHSSRASVEEAVVKLHAAGLVDFAYMGGEFKIILVESQNGLE